MSFSREWEERYLAGTHLAVWPSSDLVGYVHRYAKPFSTETKVLEIGFGAGANIPFFLSIGVDYHGIEGSRSITAHVRERYPDLEDRLVTGDFTSYNYPDGYDLVVDRSAMTHNDTNSIRRGMKNLSAAMNPGSKYIGIDWFSEASSDHDQGDFVDEFTRTGITAGPLAGVGNVHFSTREHLIELFTAAGMDIVRLEHKRRQVEIPDEGYVIGSWNFVAVKN